MDVGGRPHILDENAREVEECATGSPAQSVFVKMAVTLSTRPDIIKHGCRRVEATGRDGSFPSGDAYAQMRGLKYEGPIVEGDATWNGDPSAKLEQKATKTPAAAASIGQV